jgi:uncharacterized membrane protein HdeD (DUF308 family)
MFWGIVSIILGCVAIIAPYAATMAIEALLGWILIIGGVAHFIHSFHSRATGAFVWKMLVSLLYLCVGVMFLVYPLQGIITLTFLLTIFFIVQGVFQILWALYIRHLARWGWMCFSGVTSLILGVLIWQGLPSTATWAIGLLLGINLIFTGWSIVMFAMAVKAKG